MWIVTISISAVILATLIWWGWFVYDVIRYARRGEVKIKGVTYGQRTGVCRKPDRLQKRG